MSSGPEVSIRLAQTHDEYAGCEELSRAIWGAAERNVVPRELLLTMQHNGGIVQAAWLPDGTIVGFVFGFLGMRDGMLRLCSHQLGVLPAYRGQGLGVRLKLAQAEEARRRGLRLITWTFDPLEARNAYLNLHQLGAVARRYDRDHYGVMNDDLNRGLATDRFEAEWWIDMEVAPVGTHPQEEASPQRQWGVTRPHQHEVAEAPVLLRVGVGEAPSAQPIRLAGSGVALVEVPSDFQALKGRSLPLARQWRQASRQVLEAVLAQGFQAVDFLRRGAYVMVRP